MSLKPGINDVNNEDYHGDRDYLSSSALKLLLKDIRTFHKKYVLNIQEPNGNQTALDLGTYAHTACFEPHLIEEQFAIFEGRKAGKAWEEFKELNNNKIVLGGVQKATGDAVRDSFLNSKISQDLVKQGQAELTLCTEIEGIKVKVRADFIDPERGIIVDLKTTTGDLTAYNIQKTIAKWQYDLSASLYVDAYASFYKRPFDFYFIFVDKSSSNLQVVKSSQSLLRNGTLKYLHAIARYKEALLTNDWGSEEMLTIGPADWDKMEEDI